MAIQFLTDVNADSGTLYVDAAAGTVGIGTTSPTDKLQVTGSSGTSLTSTQGVALTVKGGGNSNNIQVWGSSSSQATYAVLTSSGKFGIGTTSPSSTLQVSGTSLVTGSVTGAIAQFTNTSGTGGAGVQIQGGPSSGGVILKLSDYLGNQRLLVAGDGNTQIAGSVTIDTIANATGDTDKFLVSNSGIVQYRTGAELAADIGAVTGGPFLPLAPTGTDVITGDVRIAENKYFRFGASANAGGSLIIGHTNFGSPVSQILENGTGDLKISATNLILESANAETYIDCNFNSSVDLYHNNVKKFETTSTGVGVTGNATFLDSGKAIFGTGSDLEIYNDGSNSYFDNKTAGQNIIFNLNELSGTPEFKIINSTTGDPFAVFNKSSFTVYEDGSEIIKANSSAVELTNSLDLKSYTATAVSTTGPLNANQNNQAPTQDTLATLSVDPSGNVVRGEQEATFTFTKAQLNSTLGQTLISAPGADKAVVVTYTDWMMKYSSTGTTTNNLEIRQANLAQANASVSVLPALRFNEIVNQSQSGSAPFYGFYTRDIPTGSGSQGRTYAVNKATTIHKQNSGTYPAGLTSISIKIRYRIFDVDTF